MTSSDEDVNILTTCFCLIIFISSGSGYSGFTSIEIDRSINRSVVIKAPYALTTKSDLELFSPVTSSEEDITIFRGYYCEYQLAERPVWQGIICETSCKCKPQAQCTLNVHVHCMTLCILCQSLCGHILFTSECLFFNKSTISVKR